jgi:hypothetical protein
MTGLENTIVATFGDLMRVPGTESSLQNERACGKDIRMVYSTFDALDLARKNPDKKIIFLGSALKPPLRPLQHPLFPPFLKVSLIILFIALINVSYLRFSPSWKIKMSILMD